jgi:hypothetical protein
MSYDVAPKAASGVSAMVIAVMPDMRRFMKKKGRK